jgi:hypothetical protein
LPRCGPEVGVVSPHGNDPWLGVLRGYNSCVGGPQGYNKCVNGI